MSRPGQRWSQLHHGIDADRITLLRGWLRLMWTLARPLAALRVPPTLLTAVGVLLAVDAVLVAERAPGLALIAVLAAVLCDGLDGAVAVLSDAATTFGAVADKAADRLAECLFAVVLWRCGAPWWLALCAAALSLALEAVRELAGGARRARLTVAERPTRAVCTVLGCGAAAVSTAFWPVAACAAVWCGLGLIGLAQIAPQTGRPFQRSVPRRHPNSERTTR